MIGKYSLLQIALFAFGLVSCLLYPLSIVWPSGWSWHAGPPMASHYFMMIVGVYATLGVFLILAARNPAANASLIWFAIVSSVVHALIMAVQAAGDPMQHGHLAGDVPALLVGAVVLGGLMMAPGRRTGV
ncbi:MAG TPA: DUF6632 domain-containing protein [Sphingomonas sp.]|nr:DUF6632 domain-containing protein [Sphingomonas sp.]